MTDLGRGTDSSGREEGNRRSRLLGIKLRALVSEHLSVEVTADVETFPHGAALVHDGIAWVLADGDAARSLGAALVWTIRRSAQALQLIAASHTALLTRRADQFSLPTMVWFVEERTLLPALAEPLAPPPSAQADHDALRAMISEAGARPNVEHGVVFGEVRGLEVCRVVDRPTRGYLGEHVDPVDSALLEGVRLEVGVGAADREAFQMLHGELPTVAALAKVVESVVAVRSVHSPQHPLNRLGAERFLRWQAEEAPGLVGLVSLEASEPPLPRPNLKDPTPCVAIGADAAGRVRRVVFSSGVDLDALPYVADVQLMGPEPVTLALPGRDVLPVVEQLAELLVDPIDIVRLG